MWGQSKKVAICKSGTESSPENKLASTHKFLLFSHPVYGILLWQPEQNKTPASSIMLQDLCSERFQWADIPSRPTLTRAKFLPVIHLLFHINGHNTAFSHTPFLLRHILYIKSQMRQILQDKNALKIQVYYEALVVQRVFSLSLSWSQGLSIKEVGWA